MSGGRRLRTARVSPDPGLRRVTPEPAEEGLGGVREDADGDHGHRDEGGDLEAEAAEARAAVEQVERGRRGRLAHELGDGRHAREQRHGEPAGANLGGEHGPGPAVPAPAVHAPGRGGRRGLAAERRRGHGLGPQRRAQGAGQERGREALALEQRVRVPEVELLVAQLREHSGRAGEAGLEHAPAGAGKGGGAAAASPVSSAAGAEGGERRSGEADLPQQQPLPLRLPSTEETV
mmetsp:Transcript_84305/g.272902  ORF Transcript_84305/g.272902 Transcript_84305/m.272902 type:complete len:234 (-) Transcript_84305:703-1404(-)